MPSRPSKKPLRNKELLFDVITGNLMDAIVLLDAEGRKLYASAATGEILGYELNALEEWAFFEQIHPDDMPSLQEGFRMLLHQHTGESLFLYRQKNKQGQYIWLEIKLRKLSSQPIPAAQFIGIIRNVSQRIITEQQNMVQKNLLETAFHLFPFSTIILDKQNKLVFVNQYILNLLGLPSEGSKAKTLYDLLPEDAERFARDNFQVWQTGKETIKEDIIQTKDKVYIVLMGRKLIQPLPNGEKLLLTHAIDITERKIAEKETEINRNFIRSITLAIPDILYVYDLEEKKYLFTNHGFEKTLGYTPHQMEDMSSSLIQALVHPEDAPALKDVFTEIARGEKDFFEYRCRLIDVSGNYRWFHCRIMAFKKNNAGHITQIVGLVQDIHLRHQAEETVETAHDSPEYRDETSIASINFGLFDQLFLKTPGQYVNFLQTYINEVDTYQQDFKQAILEKDYILFRKTRHKINAAVHHLKADELNKVLLKMEGYLKGTVPSASPYSFVTELQIEFDKIKEAITDKVKSLK